MPDTGQKRSLAQSTRQSVPSFLLLWTSRAEAGNRPDSSGKLRITRNELRTQVVHEAARADVSRVESMNVPDALTGICHHVSCQ